MSDYMAAQMDRQIEGAQHTYTEMAAEIDRLRAAALVPGVVRCAKCTFQLHRTNLYLASGITGSGDNTSEPCPNGCGPLWQVTWKQWAEEATQTAERFFEECRQLKEGPHGDYDLDAWLEWCKEKKTLLEERDALLKVAHAVDDAMTNYERIGEICPFEGNPMIYAETLTELGDSARAALAQVEQP